MTLRRSPMKPGSGFKSAAHSRIEGKEAQAVKKLRAKKCANKACGERYMPDPARPQIKWCGPDCGTAIALAKLAQQKIKQGAASKRAARAERVADKVALEKHKRRADYIANAQKAFNAFIRERDKDQPCICCGRAETAVQGLYSHGWDCGHYRSRGSAPHLRFDERNAHRQLVYCNRRKAGNAADYRIGLIARIGLAEVEALECDQAERPQSVDDLKAIKAMYVQKLKQLKGK